MSSSSVSANSTALHLDLALSSLSTALSALPSNLSGVPLPLLASLLTSLATNLSAVTIDLAGTTEAQGLRDLLMGTEAANSTFTPDLVGTMRYTVFTVRILFSLSLGRKEGQAGLMLSGGAGVGAGCGFCCHSPWVGGDAEGSPEVDAEKKVRREGPADGGTERAGGYDSRKRRGNPWEPGEDGVRGLSPSFL